jgi:hypothetical protein
MHNTKVTFEKAHASGADVTLRLVQVLTAEISLRHPPTAPRATRFLNQAFGVRRTSRTWHQIIAPVAQGLREAMEV